MESVMMMMKVMIPIIIKVSSREQDFEEMMMMISVLH
jgi:hypothetical protein